MNDVLTALQTLYTDPSSSAKDTANRWLQNFQKEPEAWETANLILSSPDAPTEPKLFAAQTFKTKIVYDLDQLPSEHRLPLRDTLLAALKRIGPGERAILTQLCLALSDLLLQLPEWQNALQQMIDQLGSAPETVPALLHFLEVLPEELANVRLRITNHDWRTDKTGEQVIQLITMYFQAPGVTPQVRRQTLTCLRSWVYAGEMTPSLVQASPFFDFAFTSLSSDELFDDSVDFLCSLIHETQEVGDNLPVIEAIVPRLVALRPNLANAIQEQDTDQVRGLCRLFVEAGEWYAQLMLQHPPTFFPIVEGIADCSAFEDLDVVSITLNFWWKLAVGLRKGGHVNDPQCQPFLEIIGRLVDIVISHLRYPQDPSTLTGQDKDDFRTFRHSIGDTLKDCCSVLGATMCLSRSFSLIEAEMANGGGNWQVIEAALFSMRAMGAKVDTTEAEVMPRIFAVIPQLPQTQSKIRYAATLVVARYTEWLAVHPDLIPAMLEYVLAGFSVNQDETAVASASALKYLCKDCSQHLVSYLPPLFQFIQEFGPKLHQDDYLDICEGFAHVIATMPPSDGIPALQTFCGPILEQVHALVSRPDATATKAELQSCSDALERLNIFLNIDAHLSDSLPPACSSTAVEVWQIFDSLLVKYGNSSLAERTCSSIRRGLTFFGRLALPLAPAILDRMASSFEATAVSGYIWIAGRVPELLRFAESDPQAQDTLKSHLAQTFDVISNKLVSMLATSSPTDVQDCIEDYLHFLRHLIDHTPDLVFLSSAFPNAVQMAISAITLLNANVSHDGIDTIRLIVGHDSLRPQSAQPAVPPNAKEAASWPSYASAIRSIISQPDVGGRLVHILLSRLVTDFHEDCAPMSVTLGRILAERFPSEMAQWVPAAVAQISLKDLREPERQRFLDSFSEGISTGNLGKVRNAWTALDRMSRKERERMTMR